LYRPVPCAQLEKSPAACVGRARPPSAQPEPKTLFRGRRQQLWLVTIRDDRTRLIARGHVRLQNLTE
jgi:hypothetical protein